MNILSAQGLTKTLGVKTLLSGVTLGIDENDRIGVIGINGCGKSTLLRILAGGEPHDSGLLTMRQGLRIAYLPQNPVFDEDHTVVEDVFYSAREVAALVREYEVLCAHMAKAPEDQALLARFEETHRRMDAASAWEFETRARTVLGKLGIEDLETRVGSLSGGYRKRVALARTLLSDADLLILDEPTNHLDADTVAWLEDYLERFNGAVILVTHDRYFLDRVTNKILELDSGQLRQFEGNFSYYVERKAEIEAAAVSHEQRRRSILSKELEWLRRGARARTTKAKARVQKVEELQNVSYARMREEISFVGGSRRLGNKIVELEGVEKSFGERKLIRNYAYTFKRGERLGIVGPNGSGKSTFANLLTGRLAPDKGKVTIGETVAFGYFDQESHPLDPNERALDYVKREGGDLLRGTDGSTMSATLVMERFLFTSQMLYSPIEKLSGGERRRLYLVRTLMSDPNFLILDEPTNDLDIATLQALEDFLDTYSGCLVVISHDRYFLDRTVDQLLAFEGGGELLTYPGTYETYARMKAERDAAKAAEASARTSSARVAPVVKESVSAKPAKLSFKEQRELGILEEEIPKMETRLGQLDVEMVGAATDYVRLQELANEQKELTAKLDASMERWAELAERQR